MHYRKLGRTGIATSEVGFGAWAIGGNAHGNSYGDTDDVVSIAAIMRASELGCTFFDTADVYGWGHSEEILGQALEGHRADVVIATKVGGDFYHGGVKLNFAPEYVQFALAESLKRLRTDYVDLYQLHNPPLELLKSGALVETMAALKSSGQIRAWGVSIHQPEEGLAAIAAGAPDAIQVVYSAFRQEAAPTFFAAAQAAGVGILAREPLFNGFLTGKYTTASAWERGDIRANFPRGMVQQLVENVGTLQRYFASERRFEPLAQLAIKFALSNPAVSCVIPGIKTPAHATDNLSASDIPDFTREQIAWLTSGS